MWTVKVNQSTRTAGAHDYSSLPIGMSTNIYVESGKLVAEGKFAPADANPFAQQVRKLYDLGMVNATSVGFIPKEYDGSKSGVISKSELLEFSFVPVPANPYALRLSQVQKLGIDMNMLRTKGIEIKEEAEPAPAPATDTTTAVVASAEGDKQKGEVAAALDATEAREQKWQKYMEICEALDAFCTVYFDDNTPVEDFGKLLTETIALLQEVVSNDGMDDDDTDENTEKMLAGRKSLTLHKTVLELYKNNFALGNSTLAAGEKGRTETTPAPQRSKNSEALKEVNSFVETRELLRSVDKSIEKVLANFNRAARTQ
jgi:hypothetical protein